jgi:hypothetical protein
VQGGGDIPDPALLAQINDLTQQVAELTAQLASAGKPVGSLQLAVENAEQNAAMANAEKDTSAAAWKQQLRVLQEGNATLLANAGDAGALESQITDLNKDKLGLIQTSAEKDKTIAELQAKNTAIQSAAELSESNCKEQKGILSSENTTLQNKVSSANDVNEKQSADLKKSIISLKDQLRKATEDGDALNGLLLLAQQNLAAVTNELKVKTEKDSAAEKAKEVTAQAPTNPEKRVTGNGEPKAAKVYPTAKQVNKAAAEAARRDNEQKRLLADAARRANEAAAAAALKANQEAAKAAQEKEILNTQF